MTSTVTLVKDDTIYVNRHYAGGQMAPVAGAISYVRREAWDDSAVALNVGESTEFRNWAVIVLVPWVGFKQRVTNSGNGYYLVQRRVLGFWTKGKVRPVPPS